MLIEHRTYTLQLGVTELFWDAQRERGDDGLRPILERLIGAFATRSGPVDQIISLYRYDSFDDWRTRLLELPGKVELQPYFRAVRPLIVRQESRFLIPAPLPALTPYWGNHRDWLPAHGSLLPIQRAASLIEETTLTFSAGGIPACWESFDKNSLIDDPMVMAGLIGTFSSIAGQLNQVLLYRCFSSVEAWSTHQTALRTSAPWRSFLRMLAPLNARCESRLLAPSPVTDMSPMFPYA